MGAPPPPLGRALLKEEGKKERDCHLPANHQWCEAFRKDGEGTVKRLQFGFMKSLCAAAAAKHTQSAFSRSVDLARRSSQPGYASARWQLATPGSLSQGEGGHDAGQGSNWELLLRHGQHRRRAAAIPRPGPITELYTSTTSSPTNGRQLA